jgi:hypothetical protein
MRKDGRYCLVVWIKPKFDKEGRIVGYIAGRKIPDRNKMNQALELYKKLKTEEEAKNLPGS